MRQFDKIYTQFVTEEDQPILATGNQNNDQQGTDQLNKQAAAEPSIDNQQEPEQKTFDSSSFVTMVRLLKDAFVIRPNDEDASQIVNLGDINASNASEKFKQVLNMVKKYMPDLDIDLGNIK